MNRTSMTEYRIEGDNVVVVKESVMNIQNLQYEIENLEHNKERLEREVIALNKDLEENVSSTTKLKKALGEMSDD